MSDEYESDKEYSEPEDCYYDGWRPDLSDEEWERLKEEQDRADQRLRVSVARHALTKLGVTPRPERVAAIAPQIAWSEYSDPEGKHYDLEFDCNPESLVRRRFPGLVRLAARRGAPIPTPVARRPARSTTRAPRVRAHRRRTAVRGSPSDDPESEPPLASPNLAVAAGRRSMPELCEAITEFVRTSPASRKAA